jgi:predicted TIM-barrel fold metal-dependent hydrolase
MGKRMVVVTTDSHIGRPEIDFTPYFDLQHRSAYAEQRQTAMEMMKAISAEGGANPLMATMMGGATFMDPAAVAAQQTRRRAKLAEIGIEGFRDNEFMMVAGDSDHGDRLKALEADGVSGAVLFPQGGAFGAFGRPADEDLYWSGHRAHNRWLADFVSNAPERWAGTIQGDLADIDRTVDELKWGRENGLRGGYFNSGCRPEGLPNFNSPYYDKLWAALEDYDLPFVMHAAFPAEGLNAVFNTTQRGGLALTKLGSYDHINKGGPLSHFIFGGVFDRHPKMKVVIAETGGADWILPAMEVYDAIHAADENTRTPSIKPVEPIWDSQLPALRALPQKPSAYLGRNIWVQAHCHHRDWGCYRDIKPENMVWGSDFPHAESTWPNSMTYFAEIVQKFGVPRADLETIFSANPAKIFGFDLEALQPVADRIGPDYDALSGAVSVAAE